MAEHVTTGFILLGGLVGIALGLYGLAPAFFGARLKRLREAAASTWLDDGEAEGEDGFDLAFDLLVGSRRREHSLFGLPAAWRDPDPAPVMVVAAPAAALLEGSRVESLPGLLPLPPVTPLAQTLEPGTYAPAVVAPEQGDYPDQEVLDLFREVLPQAATAAVRARQAIGEEALPAVGIRDLLADARWTMRALGTPREVART